MGLGLCALGIVAGLPAAAQNDQLPGLTIRNGESWIFRVQDGQPVDARKADGKEEPAKGELRVTVSAMGGTMMSVTNNSDIWYNYHAFITTKPGKKGTPTSVCTLMGGGRGAFESWPGGAIPAIRIADFTPADEGSMSCQ
jgi:hypothetical protein